MDHRFIRRGVANQKNRAWKGLAGRVEVASAMIAKRDCAIRGRLRDVLERRNSVPRRVELVFSAQVAVLFWDRPRLNRRSSQY
jgi:hypothetical protein